MKPLNEYIDHTMLKAEVLDLAFEILCDEAIKYKFRAVCVSPYIASGVVKAMLPEPDIKVATVVAFPQGNIPLILKLREASYMIDQGVDEIDFVLHYGEVLNQNWDRVAAEMGAMGEMCAQGNVVSKCIVETPVLQHKALLKKVFQILSEESCIDFIKSSTGMSYRGTKVSEIAYWNELRGHSDRPLIKAAGGIKTYEDAIAMVRAGADRLGMSASVKVMEDYLANPSAFTEGGAPPAKVHEERDDSGSTGNLV